MNRTTCPSPQSLKRMVALLRAGDRVTVANRPAASALARAWRATGGQAKVSHLRRAVWLVERA